MAHWSPPCQDPLPGSRLFFRVLLLSVSDCHFRTAFYVGDEGSLFGLRDELASQAGAEC